MTTQLPMPIRCTDRRTSGVPGVPWIRLNAGGRYLFGALDKDRHDRAPAELLADYDEWVKVASARRPGQKGGEA
ncbi:hypothetical protein [Streptomyces mobaraensis]|uniref:Uncharacterized protein n=1 Tax=Streptomyces mobaraensis TaxID=35621 RepID=A0A5N5W3Y8_STRMB|nr:hypothetical protein [Streptomyces mobaraensis]KAB7839503.1 hypothetical protein FRZ00_21445 [Streptomyces mobaraensis]